MSGTEIVMYSRTIGCPFVTLARRVLDDHGLPYREVFIDPDPEARQRVLRWTGFLSIPTLVITRPGSDLPITLPVNLPPGISPRGINRGHLITEPDERELLDWLVQHGLLQANAR